MNKKILAFVYDGEKVLALRNNSIDPSHGGDYWFTVTGSLESDENEEDAIKREVKEETNLNVEEIFNLNWSSVYSWGNKDHLEKNFVVFVKKKEIKLNRENVEYEWLNLDDFIKRIKWDLDKIKLKKVLEKGIKKQLFFKKEQINDFRK